jgi:hypothetical protein
MLIQYYKASLINLFSKLQKVYADPENSASLCLGPHFAPFNGGFREYRVS